MPTDTERLRHIKTFDDLVLYLEDELGWPLQEYGFDQLTFEYLPNELGLKEDEAAKVKAIHQLRPLNSGQPWGIFFIEFEKKKLPVVVLRRILSHLVIKQRASANKSNAAAWQTDDLLFVTAYGDEAAEDREIAFAHFHQQTGDLPTLRVLDWDGGDTKLKLENIAHKLKQYLHWPEDPSDIDSWREAWRKPFKHRIGHVIRTADALAEALATLARGIYGKASRMLDVETDAGPLRKLHKAFQSSLIHDLTEDDFADTYAQTITYGLLTAAISRTDMSEGKHGTALTAHDIADIVPVTNPFLKEMLQTFLKVGGRKGGIDFDELGIQDVVELLRGEETDLPEILADFGKKKQNEDPVIHFYEHFLEAYDKKRKVQRGVFYTPQSVVSFIVRSVDELLRTEFGLEDGLASVATWSELTKLRPAITISDGTSPESFFVQILDPATGTGTFLVEVIDVIHRTMMDKWQRQGLNEAKRFQAWNDYVPNFLLPRLHGYELMMAPYAIAHMKIGLKLHETGYHFGSDERVHVYLTNTLEPAADVQPQLTGMAPALAHEASAVNEVKLRRQFTVVIGNPPYSGISSNMTELSQRLVDAYRIVDGQALNEKKLWLQDDYVKFIRKAQTIIDKTGSGIFGFITNHGYLDNPTFRGMRQSIISTFQQLCFIDLHGNANKKEQSPDGSEDKNVFDIRQGVAICLGVRGDVTRYVRHADLWGSREEKYKWLEKHSVLDAAFSKLCPDSPYYFFAPQNIDLRSEFEHGWKINEAMPFNSAGFITARDHFVVDFDGVNLLKRISAFANPKLSDDEIRTTYFAGCGSAKYPDGDTRGWKIPAARTRVMNDKDWQKRVRTCLYRPFDNREVYWTDWMIDWPRPELTRHLDISGNKALITTRITKDIFSVFPTRMPPGHKSVGAYDVNYVFPLWVAPEQSSLFAKNVEIHSNFSQQFIEFLAAALGLKTDGENGMPSGYSPDDIFQYVYAVLHSPNYRSRYSEFLKIDFPRIPATRNQKLFCALVRFGGELLDLQLLESSKLKNSITTLVGSQRLEVEKPSWSDNTVWINKSKSNGFKGISEEIWNFHIGGYQVCEKWLKDRKGRLLSADDIAHYEKIVVALNETIRLMAEIDDAIDLHGGWPGAFS